MLQQCRILPCDSGPSDNAARFWTCAELASCVDAVVENASALAKSHLQKSPKPLIKKSTSSCIKEGVGTLLIWRHLAQILP